jgi:hypothetical protein
MGGSVMAGNMLCRDPIVEDDGRRFGNLTGDGKPLECGAAPGEYGPEGRVADGGAEPA